MATKKAARKKARKKATKKATKKKCHTLQINDDGTITPPSMTIQSNECVIFLSPDGYDVDMQLVIELEGGGGGPITIHS
jgi:hypothetical protein